MHLQKAGTEAGQAVREEKGKSNVVAELGTKLGSNPNVATNWSTQGHPMVGVKRTRGQPETAPRRMSSRGQCLDHCTNHQ